MGANRREDRPRRARTFQPSLDGRLEDRLLLSHGHTIFPRTGNLLNQVQTFVKDGGRGVRIFNGLGSAFDVQIVSGPGTVTATPLANGTMKIVITGSDPTTEVDINPVREVFNHFKAKRQAHNFHVEFSYGNHLLNIGELDVTSGRIGQILGYRTATLSGPLVISGTSPVSRLAFYQLLPGALIETGNDLNTLDIFNSATLSGANTGIFVNQDLNLLNIGGNLTIQNGANVSVGRDIGNTPQPPKGSGTGSNVLQVLYTFTSAIATGEPLVGAYILGNVTIDPTSSFTVGRQIDQLIYVLGNLSGKARVTPPPLIYNAPSNAPPPPVALNVWWVGGTVS